MHWTSHGRGFYNIWGIGNFLALGIERRAFAWGSVAFAGWLLSPLPPQLPSPLPFPQLQTLFSPPGRNRSLQSHRLFIISSTLNDLPSEYLKNVLSVLDF